MKSKYLTLALIAGAAVSLTSCSKMGELGAENFSVDPQPLETVGNTVPVTINGRFPAKYMKKKAVVTVTPELRYEGGEATGESSTFQGEKVAGNNQTISYRVGGNYTIKTTFDYVPAMMESDLYVTFNARKGSKKVEIPDVKIGYGVIATSTLAARTILGNGGIMAPDAYEHVIRQEQDANIKFLIQQSKIRTSELETVSVQKFIETLHEIQADRNRHEIESVDIAAYASPDGGVALNSALAQDRERNTADYVKKELDKADLQANLNTNYTAEDWEGFKELVQASNIQDKEVILRVLSMYSDPEEREQQIRNLSAAFTDLATEILPELRRSRISVSYDLIGRSDDEIQEQYSTDPSQLSVEELLYCATLTEDTAAQRDIYVRTSKLYSSDYRAYNNIGTIAWAEGNIDEAKTYYKIAASKSQSADEANINLANLALAEGDVEEAKSYLSKASNSSAASEVLGNIYLIEGNYSQAVASYGDTYTNSAALAQLLTTDYLKSAETLSVVEDDDAMTYYLKAVIAARTNNNSLAVDNLRQAISKDSSLSAYAAKDLEFTKLRQDSSFKILTSN